ncbi:hypothetical protein [Kitasatospora cheerisanensis]|uniref:Uncharacterized protein n=1 Tax=Kitasatospora cheerisanensis KCTC 2395 TaxID=1348663 RepID=A0A066Z2E9_9ACTN|nr:hypothetical protein [Kitasatospora cheerisanensis]KDN86419.1 hypothetical protein KCH_22360 [Kitasatospora cheerisanensis KCTC 2395]
MDDRTAAVSVRPSYARRSAMAFAAASLAAGLLTACGSSGSTAPAGPGSPSPTAAASDATSAPGSVPPGSPTATAGASSPAGSSTPSAGEPTSPGIAVGEHPPTAVKIPVTGYRQDSPTQLTVFYVAGVCDKYGVRLEDATPPTVKLRIVITKTAEPGKACPQVMKEQEATVTLPHPMNGGGVVDTATGEQVPPQSGGVGAGGPR